MASFMRISRSVLQILIVLISVGWALNVPRRLNMAFFTEQMLVLVLAFSLAVIFFGVAERKETPNWLKWLYGAVAVICIPAAAYVAIRFPEFVILAASKPLDLVSVSLFFIVATIWGVRLTSGWGVTVVVLGFITYALLGQYVPGEFRVRPVSFQRLAVYLGSDPNGILGIALSVASIIVIPFILFGHGLSRFGAGDFFTDFASALMGRYRGGSAKIAVTASALFGTISGSAVGNVVGSGILTIPLMKRSGFDARTAAAVEAVASTGGQLVPPVMGAAAFLMADFLSISYGTVVIAALIPAFLYFLALFIQIDLFAEKEGIAAIPREDIPKLGETLKSGWHFILPFVVLVYTMFGMRMRPEMAAIWAVAALTLTSLVFGYRGRRPSLKDIGSVIVETGSAVKEIIAICAAAGIVIGVLNMTGLAFNLTIQLVQFSGDNIFVLVVITAAISIVLGMGMPTVGVYVLLGTLVAPALVKVGMVPIAAHMFVFYFGLLSMITPPVALAAFAGANLANADPWMTSWRAVRLGWSAYIVPFLFLFSPSLLMMGEPGEIIWALLTAIVGIWAVTVGMVGQFSRRLGVGFRLFYVVFGFIVLVPTNGVQLAIFGEIAALLVLTAGSYWLLRNKPDGAARPGGKAPQTA